MNYLRQIGNVFCLSSFLFSVQSRYDEAIVEYKPYRQKDGALLAIGALCDKLKQTEPYKSELERMLVQHVFPEFSSPAGHLRAKVCFSLYFFSSSFQNEILCLLSLDTMLYHECEVGIELVLPVVSLNKGSS